MALIKCTECGKEFSDKASACPNCGCPTKDVLSELARSQETLEAEPKTAEPPAPETPTTPVESAPQSTPSEMIRPATGNDDTEKPCGEKKGHNIVQMLVGLFICFAILCAGFFVFSKKTNKNLQDTHTQTKRAILTILQETPPPRPALIRKRRTRTPPAIRMMTLFTVHS